MCFPKIFIENFQLPIRFQFSVNFIAIMLSCRLVVNIDSQREQASQIASEGASQSVSEPASILADCFSVFQFAVLWKNDDWETFKLMEAKTFKKHDVLRTQGGWTETHSQFFLPFSLLYTQNIYTLIPVNFLKPQPSSTAFHDTLQYQPLSQSPSLS